MNPYTQFEINIARICHEANRALCENLGDWSQPSWEQAPGWQKESAYLGVHNILMGEIHHPRESHECWMKQKETDGWKFGSVKDPEKKEHPCMVPFSDLPESQQQKDYLFFAIVKSFGRK